MMKVNNGAISSYRMTRHLLVDVSTQLFSVCTRSLFLCAGELVRAISLGRRDLQLRLAKRATSLLGDGETEYIRNKKQSSYIV